MAIMEKDFSISSYSMISNLIQGMVEMHQVAIAKMKDLYKTNTISISLMERVVSEARICVTDMDDLISNFENNITNLVCTELDWEDVRKDIENNLVNSASSEVDLSDESGYRGEKAVNPSKVEMFSKSFSRNELKSGSPNIFEMYDKQHSSGNMSLEYLEEYINQNISNSYERIELNFPNFTQRYSKKVFIKLNQESYDFNVDFTHTNGFQCKLQIMLPSDKLNWLPPFTGMTLVVIDRHINSVKHAQFTNFSNETNYIYLQTSSLWLESVLKHIFDPYNYHLVFIGYVQPQVLHLFKPDYVISIDDENNDAETKIDNLENFKINKPSEKYMKMYNKLGRPSDASKMYARTIMCHNIPLLFLEQFICRNITDSFERIQLNFPNFTHDYTENVFINMMKGSYLFDVEFIFKNVLHCRVKIMIPSDKSNWLPPFTGMAIAVIDKHTNLVNQAKFTNYIFRENYIFFHNFYIKCNNGLVHAITPANYAIVFIGYIEQRKLDTLKQL